MSTPIDTFLNDPKFQEYAFEGKHKEYWSKYLQEKPDQRPAFLYAERIIQSLEFKEYRLSPEQYQFYLNRYNSAIYSGSVDRKQVKSHKIFHWDYFLKFAAVIAILVSSFAAFLYFHLQLQTPVTDSKIINDNKIVRSVPRQVKSSVVLRDGTLVKLNSESTLEFPAEFSSDTREVKLKGEGFFEVASDANRPFIINCDDLIIKVLGTDFNVRTYPDEAKASVAVKSGKVEINTQIDGIKQTQVIEMGEMLSLQKRDMKIVVTSFDAEESFGWTEGKIVFTDADISEIVQRLERWYDVEIHIDMKKRIVKGYSGKFSNVSLEHILEGIGFSLGFKYEINDKQVKIFD